MRFFNLCLTGAALIGAVFLSFNLPLAEAAPRDRPVGLAFARYQDATRADWNGRGPRPVVAAVWYPAPAGTAETAWRVGIFNAGRNAIDAPMAPAPGKLPLVVISHGTGGGSASIAWLNKPRATSWARTWASAWVTSRPASRGRRSAVFLATTAWVLATTTTCQNAPSRMPTWHINPRI